MSINLSKEFEQFVDGAVRAGLYASEDDVVNDALSRLKQTMPKNTATPERRTKKANPASKKKTLTEAELQQRMLEIGLMSRLPDNSADFDDPDDRLIEIQGEPLSETIIRERR